MRSGLPAEAPLLLFVGRIQPLKGADVAVRALAAMDRTIPTRISSSWGARAVHAARSTSPRCEKLVDDLGLAERVRFEEPQPHELLSTYYRAADVCVVPSRSESFGLVALEAAACGTPVVAAAVGGLTTLVEDGRTGLVVDPSTPMRSPAPSAGSSPTPCWPSDWPPRRWSVPAATPGPQAASLLRDTYEELTAERLVDCR